MFRNGGSEYAINGSHCRLLDVQELLSDSGIGREMHVIVGQGQLDSILHATPEDRRGFIEEAAGVLKHRKRKEKALRKLESTEGNLTRLADLLTEIRRQLKPLGPPGRGGPPGRRGAGRRPRRPRPPDGRRPGHRHAPRWSRSSPTSRSWSSAAPSWRPRWPRPARPRPPSRRPCARTCRPWPRRRRPGSASPGCASACAARRASPPSASATPPPSREVPEGRDPDELEAEAERVRAQEEQILAEVGRQPRRRSRRALAARQAAEQAFAEEERRVAGLHRAAADRREGMARLHGQVNGLRSRAAAAEEEVGRLTQARAEAVARAERAQHDFTVARVAGRRARRRRGGARLRARGGRRPARPTSRTGWPRPARRSPTAERERTALTARREALEIGLNRKDGAGALLAATDAASAGCSAPSPRCSACGSGYESAVAAALGSAADAVAVSGVDAALGRHRPPQGRRPRPGGHPARPRRRADDSSRVPVGDLFAGATYAVGRGGVPGRPAAGASSACSTSVVVVDDLAAARGLVRDHPHVTAVTRDGDVLGAHFAAGGSVAPAEPARGAGRRRRGGRAAGRRRPHPASGSRFDTATLEREREEAQRRVDVALAKLHESDATLAAVAEELGQFGSQSRNARAEAARLDEAIEAARGRARRATSAGLAELESRLAAAEDAPDEEPDTDRARPAGRGGPGRARRRDGGPARPAHRRGAGPRAARPGRLRCGAPRRAEREARAAAIARREQLLHEGRVGEAVGRAAAVVLARLEESIALRRGRAQPRRGGPRGPRGPSCARRATRLRDLGRELDELVNDDPPRRDGADPAADADRAARGARARGARARRRRRWSPSTAPTSSCPVLIGPRLRRGRGGTGAGAVRPRGADQAAAHRRAGAGAARPDQPAGAGGVLRARGAAQVPHRAARGPPQHPPRPARHRPRGRRAGRAGLHRGLRRRERGLRADLRPAVPRRRGPAGAHRPRRHARHRGRGRGPPAGQEDQAALAALRRRALPGRRGVPGRAVQGAPVARSTSSTRSRRRSTTPTSAGCWRSTRSCARTPSCW